MEVRAKKSLGQHFLVDLGAAQRIVAALAAEGGGTCPATGRQVKQDFPEIQEVASQPRPDLSACSRTGAKRDVLEIGPGMGVLTRYLLQRPELNLKMVELDGESVQFLRSHFSGMDGRLLQADYLKLDVHKVFPGEYSVIGNFPYNISSQIFFKILDDRDRVPEVVCMIQKEVAERIAEGPGSKTYGILSVLLQAWYDIEYLFTVEPGAFAPPPKVRSAVIRLRRNSRTELLARPVTLQAHRCEGLAPTCDATGPQVEGVSVDEALFRKVVKTAFGQRRKTLRNALRQILPADYDLSEPTLQQRAEQLGVDDFIALAARISR